MNIIVCVKQVPDTTQIRLNPETKTLVRDGVENILNGSVGNRIDFER